MKRIYEKDAARYARFVDLLMAGLDEPMDFCDEMPGLIDDGGCHKPVVNEAEIRMLPLRRTTKPKYINNERIEPVRVR